MNKILLIIQREYVSRVKKKSFLLATLLTPLIFPALMGGLIYFAVQEQKSADQKIIEVIDENQLFQFEDSETYRYVNTGLGLEEAKSSMKERNVYGLLYIPKVDITNPQGITFYSAASSSMSFISSLESGLKRKIEDIRLEQSGIDLEALKSVKTAVSIKSISLTEEGVEKASSGMVNYGIGFVSGILIYIFILIYGNQVMQGVIEEKTSRIVEIIVSSVKPFQLMLGKITGVGAVGLTQFLIWVILINTLSIVILGYFGLDGSSAEMMSGQAGASSEAVQALQNSDMGATLEAFFNVNWLQIALLFIFYFLGGFLLYGAFFAAIGSAVDSPSDAQQFMFPVTIPLLVGYFGLFSFVLNDPDSTISFWLSIIPLTSPIVMMGRVGFGVPFWELALSMGLLIAGFLATTWLAGRIYRVGILMHGTKVNYAVLWKWFKVKV